MITAADPPICESCSFTLSAPHESETTNLWNLLRSNLPPPDISHFQNVASSMPLELSRYDEQIVRIQNQLNSIVMQREAFRSYAARCTSLFSPIRRLPNELLVEVFAMSSRPSEISDGTREEELFCIGKRDLCRLSQVCSYWNRIVMNTPMLWSTIMVDFDRWLNSPAPPAILRDLLESSLRRGSSFPLDLSVHAGEDAEEHEWGLALLSQHSHRWRQLSLKLDLSFLAFLFSSRDTLPLLERLEIVGWHIWPDLDLFAAAPRLKSAKFDVADATSHIPHHLLPWEQLTRFSCTGLLISDLPRLLPLLARLPIGAQLELIIDGDEFEFPPDSFTVGWNPSFLQFTFNDEGPSSMVGQLVEYLTVPHAVALGFTAHLNSLPILWHQPRFEAFAARSKLRETLKELDFERLLVTDVELLQCLSELPLLQILRISDSPQRPADHILITDHLLNSLTLRPDTPALIPHLHTFRIVSLFQFDAQAYVEFVRSRVAPRRVFTANMAWFPDHKLEFPPDMSELISEGGVVSLFSEYGRQST